MTILISGVVCFILVKTKSEVIRAMINKVKHFVSLFLIEWSLILCSIISLLYVVDALFYYKTINWGATLIFVSVASCALVYIFILILQYWDSPEKMFLILMLPIGIAFMFCMFPDFVPDEQSHFMKAFLTSTFDFSGSYDGYMFGDYAIKKITNVHSLLNEFYIEKNTNLTLYFDSACSYNFLIYIIPAIGLFVGRLLHLSIYICYYIGRMMNFFVFIYLGYKAIQITPKCKWMFLIFYFNPMIIQQGISYSADVVTNGFCILSVAYFLYLYNKPSIVEKDVIIVMGLITCVAVSKYAYLPLFGIYFALIPKLVRMSKRCWFYFSAGAVFALLIFGMSLWINSGIEAVPGQSVYLEQAGVNSSEQLHLLLTDPLRICHMYYSTFITYIGYYIKSFVSHLGWLDIMINPFSFFGWYLLAVFGVFTESSGLSKANRLSFIAFGLLIAMAVVLGLFLNWTGVGVLIAQGVQGRYFIPAALLFLIAFANDFLKNIKHKPFVISSMVLLINIPVLLDILTYFSRI